MKDTGLSKGRLSQLLDPNLPFGERAARNLEERLALPERYFDSMDTRTVEFALRFESLPADIKARWEQLVTLLARQEQP